MAPAKPVLSLVIPAYNEVDSATDIAEFYTDIQRSHTEIDFELIDASKTQVLT